MSWQPIAIAPKDGGEIVGYGYVYWLPEEENGANCARVVYWDDMEGWACSNETSQVELMNATHWMPLPEDPE